MEWNAHDQIDFVGTFSLKPAAELIGQVVDRSSNLDAGSKGSGWVLEGRQPALDRALVAQQAVASMQRATPG
jgi:hypothetical protein